MPTVSPSKPRKAAMKPATFKRLLAGRKQQEAADLLGVNVGTISRWLSGYTPISAGNALLIRSKLG